MCPTIADPAQVDLDGDHIGWLCDPVEATTIQHTGISSDFRLAVRGDTAGANFRYGCQTGTCQSAALSVGPGGVSLADSNTDTWLAAGPNWGWVSGENRVLWSFSEGGLGEQNAASNTFTTKYDGVLLGGDEVGTVRFERDQLTVLPSYSQTQGHGLLEPHENGDVLVIAESANPYDIKVITGHDPANLLFTVLSPTSRSLQRFVPGATASEAVLVGSVALSHVSDVRSIMASAGALMGVCAEQDDVRYLIPTDDNSVSSQVLPLPSCNVYGTQTTDRRLRVIVARIDGAHPMGGAMFVLDGVMHPLQIAPYGVEVVGQSLPAAIRTSSSGGAQFVHAVTATGAVHLVADNVAEAIVSSEGDTIHVVAKRGSDRVLFRYRDGTVSETTLPAFTATLDEMTLLTTKEGAALISTFETAFVVPSQSMTASAIDFDHLRGFVRGDATLFVASHNASSSKPALYSYSELGGVPQYSALTAESTATLHAYPLDSVDGARTEWFAYVKDDACVLARPEVSSSTVNLLGNVSCLAGASIDGVTRDNKLVVRVVDNVSLEQLYLLDGDTLTKVASSSTQVRLMYATQDSRVVIGWVGRDTTNENFVCLGTHPERCWTPPLATYTWAAPVTGQPDSMHVVFLEQMSGSVKFTSIKAIGPGTRPQPL
ncbi:MAG TPA: hypothetical protein VM513_22435 [Kofleriaceae bacterium]|nr:hypothetical protein [Kofleriaceae bacterium]